MECIIGTKEFKIGDPTVVTIGKFDGRHRGHQKLLRRMLKLKAQKGLKTAVFSFAVSPAALLGGGIQKMITTNQERRRRMEQIGIDYFVEYPFSDEVAHTPAERFVEEILVGKMNAKAIVVGSDCGFGYRRSGDADLLRTLSPRLGYELQVIEKMQEDSRDISSTYVREELDRGNMEKANQLLGEPYSILGTVVHGNHIGGPLLGFPTANILLPPEKYLPPFGVYVSKVYTGERIFKGISNIGKKPTIEGDNPAGVETFIYGLDEDLYGQEIEVQLLHYLRPEKKFGGLEELKRQIEKDKEAGADYLKKLDSEEI